MNNPGKNNSPFQKIFEDYYSELRAYAYRLTGSADEADDVVEDTFVDVWKNRDRLDFSGNIRSYLYRAVYSKAIDVLRRSGATGVHISLLDNINELRMEYISAADGQTHLEQKELAGRLEQAINSLPDKCRMAFRLSYINGLSNRDIALSMGVSVRTVEAHIYKALHELRAKLRNVIWILVLLSPLSKFFQTLTKYFSIKNRRICNYLRIKRLFGLHGNWVTRWQPFLFQSSLLFCTNVITLCNKGITFL